jgi:tetrahedral aminopeptidase
MSSILNADSIRFLESYINNSSPTGYEGNGQQMWLDYIEPYSDDYFQDHYMNTVAVLNPHAAFKVVLEAHADEISWIVNYIDDK